MAALVVANCVLVRLIWSNGGAPYAVNVLCGKASGIPTVNQTVANQVGSAIKGAVGTSGYGALLDPLQALQNVGVRSIHQPNQPEFLDAGAPTPGTGSAGTINVPQAAICVTLRTALAGKSFRGRVYLPGTIRTTISATGTISSTATTAAVAFVTAIDGIIAGQTWPLAVLSRVLLQANDVSLIQSRDSVWDTVRKRAYAGV